MKITIEINPNELSGIAGELSDAFALAILERDAAGLEDWTDDEELRRMKNILTEADNCYKSGRLEGVYD
jgi:hypothetical protein